MSPGQAELWLIKLAIGLELDLSLPDDSILTRYLTYPEPDLPGDRESWQNLFSTFLVKYEHHYDLLLPGQAEHLFDQFLREPISLGPDEMALVLSILALGKLAESHLGRDENSNIQDDVAFFRLGLSAIESCEQASQTGIRKS